MSWEMNTENKNSWNDFEQFRDNKSVRISKGLLFSF
jgi:hypothetical protein